MTTNHRHATAPTEPLLRDQLTWHWDAQLRPRLDGLTDEEYLWEPVPELERPSARDRHRTSPGRHR